MFGTLRYNSNTKDVEHVELERADGFEARGYSRTACNECRTRKLKCSGDENGCQRCRAISTTCIYQSTADKSTDRRRRQSTQSFTHSISVPSPDNSLEIEQTTRPQSRQQPGDQTQSTETPDTDITPVDLSWALSPLPEAPDLYWEFPSGDFQPTTDVGQNSSTGDNVPHTPAFSSCVSLTHKSHPQILDIDIEVDNDIADVSYNLEQLHQTVGPQRGSQLWDSVINLASIMDPPVPPRKHSEPAAGLSHLHAPRMRSSPAIASVAPKMTSVSSTSGLPSFSRSTSAPSGEPPRRSDTGSTCQCVTMMLKILEIMGVQGLGTDAQGTGAGLDVILSSLAHGMNMIEQVLACGQCHACTDNGMLLATIAQQLGITAASVTTCLPSQENPYESHECTHWRQNRRFSPQGRRSPDVRTIDGSGSVLDSSNNDDPARSTSDSLEGTIFFGRYKVDRPEIRLQLVYHVLLLHIRQLQEILVRIKDRVGSNRGPGKLLVNTELEVRKLWDLFHSMVSHQQ